MTKLPSLCLTQNSENPTGKALSENKTMISNTQISFQDTMRLNLNYSQAHTPFRKLQFRANGCCNFVSNTICLRRARVVVNAGYTKTPMETPGAYRLVDEETGQKVIVWGDDEDAPIPSKNVLGWEPPDDGNDDSDGDNDGTESISASRHVTSTSAQGGNFGRLKTLRVKDGPRKSSTVKQETKKHVGDQFISGSSRSSSTVSQREHEYVGKKKKVDLEQKGNVSEVVKEVIRRRRRESYEGNAGRPSRSSIKQLQEDQITSRKDSAGNVRGWGKGRPAVESGTRSFDTPVRKKSSAGKEFFSRKSFVDIRCKDYMIDALRSQQFQRPSNIQAMAFSPVVEGKSSIIADQSGSGKTLAYLIPVIQRIRDEELQGLSKSSAQSPRVIVLVPTAELASQVLSNCRSLSKYGVPFRSMVATGGFRQKTQLESLQQELDVLIATPGRFMYLIKEGFLQLTNIRCAVLDEVDILFNDEDFEIALQSLIGSSPVTTQYLFVTATLPLDIYNKLVETFPDCEVIIGPGMHRISTGLEEVLVDCSGEYGSEKTPDTAFLNKKTALLQLVDKSPVSKTIIFCNKIETCRKVENTLNRLDRKGVRSWVLPFHAAVTQEARLTNMKEFLKPRTGRDSLFLVCTDRASRGIDFAGVDHVVLFDFPRDPSEYVRRVGRTARGVGGKGKAFIFVVGKQVSLAQRIMDRNQKGHPLHDVPSSF